MSFERDTLKAHHIARLFESDAVRTSNPVVSVLRQASLHSALSKVCISSGGHTRSFRLGFAAEFTTGCSSLVRHLSGSQRAPFNRIRFDTNMHIKVVIHPQ